MGLLSDLVRAVNKHENEFEKIYKCLNKSQRAKKETEDKHLTNIICEYNVLKSIYFDNYQLINKDFRLYLETLLTKSHDKLLKIFARLNIKKIPIPELKIPQTELSDSESDTENNEMAITAIEFINFVSKTVPEYDGNPSNLQGFIDALNLVKANKGEHELSAVEVVKSKLKAPARNFITNETTLQSIVDKLQASIKPESPKLIISKLNNLKQFNKNPNEYVKEIENLSTALKTAYITQGMSIDLAETYATENVLKSIKATSTDERLKIILEAGEFNSISEVTQKFLSVKSENNQPNVQINYFQRNNRPNRYYNRGSYRGSYNANSGKRFNSVNNNNRNFRHNHGNFNTSSNRGNQGRRNFSRGNFRDVRFAESNSENLVDPQSTQHLSLRDT